MIEKTCVIEECEGRVYMRGYCCAHYRRLMRYGNPLANIYPDTCTVVGCSNRYYGRGFCSKHYQRFVKHGDAHKVLGTLPSDQLKWLSAVIVESTDNCILWPYNCTSEGYGRIKYKNHIRPAHRVALILHTGKDPEGQNACHARHEDCGNRSCVNPAHLRWDTPRNNGIDKRYDKSSPFGTANHASKILDCDVFLIRDRRESGETCTSIGNDYGLSKSTISCICLRKTWTHI